MRFVRLALLTAAVSGGSASAQVTTGTGGNTTAATTGTTGTGTTTGTGGTSGGSATADSITSASTPQLTGASIVGTTSTTPSTATTVDTSNFLNPTYSNPYYQGLYSNSNPSAPGRFGQLLYTGTAPATGTSGGLRGSTTSTGGVRTGTTAAGGNPFGTSASPFGTTTGGGRAGGGAGGATSAFGGQVIQLPRNIAYSAVLRFPTPAVAPAQRLADVQAVIGRSSMLGNPAGVTVVADGSAFVLRGSVASEDEARLAEGMVRLTPGVRDVRNELTFPKQ